MKIKDFLALSLLAFASAPLAASCVGPVREVSVFEKTADTNLAFWLGQDVCYEDLSAMTGFVFVNEDLMLFEEAKYATNGGGQPEGQVLYYARRFPRDEDLWRISEVICSWKEGFAGPIVYGIDGNTPAWMVKQKLVKLGYVDAKPVHEDAPAEFWKDGVAATYRPSSLRFVYEWDIFAPLLPRE